MNISAVILASGPVSLGYRGRENAMGVKGGRKRRNKCGKLAAWAGTGEAASDLQRLGLPGQLRRSAHPRIGAKNRGL